jgi:hypothetical protein
MRYRTLSLSVFLSVCVLAAPLHAAAKKPRTAKSDAAKTVWTNDEIEKLRARGLITFFTLPEPEPATPAADAPYDETKDPEWYAKQAALLQTELAGAQADLAQYLLTLDDAKSLNGLTGGVAIDKDPLGITPEAGIQIRERLVQDVASRIDALEDLARRNGFPPGLTRG